MKKSKKILRMAKRYLCFLAGAIFLLEAWLWNTLYPVVAIVVAWLPWDSMKTWVASSIMHLPASVCVFIFIIPALAVFPIKVLGMWLISQHHIFSGIAVFFLAKLVGLGLAAFLFETCKEKLLNLKWFLWIYKTVLQIKEWSARQVAPVIKQISAIRKRFSGEKKYLLKVFKRIRRNIARAGKL